MQSSRSSTSFLYIHSVCLLISILGTAIFALATLLTYLILGILIETLLIIAVIFFLVMLVALFLFVYCIETQFCRPPDCCRYGPGL